MQESQLNRQKRWSGRKSGQELYLHEKVKCINFDKVDTFSFQKTIALLGYACDEGVKRNQGRTGASEGPNAIRKPLGKMPNHLDADTRLLDLGPIECLDQDMETAQAILSEKVLLLLTKKVFPIILGGGHDIAYGHYTGIRKHLGKTKTIGIINFDAHFDLRSNALGNNSGTPFYQIAQDCKEEGLPFKYLCLGIRKDANDRMLFQTAKDLGAGYIENEHFNLHHWTKIKGQLQQFINEADHMYCTIDLDGFSSAYAPGVSAPSPMGFSPEVVLKCLKLILDSKKLISMDVAETNPIYDIDNQTAKLAASLVYFVINEL